MNARRAHADLAELAEIVRDLTQAGPHKQQRRVGWKYPNRTGPIYKDHITYQESLLNQLRKAVTNRAQIGRWNVIPGGTARGVLPHFDADAFDRLEAIRVTVDDWNARLHLDSARSHIASQVVGHIGALDPLINSCGVTQASAALDVLRDTARLIRESIEPDLRAIEKAAQSVAPDVLDDLVWQLRDCRTWCRIIAGWQEPLAKPNVPCPSCSCLPGERVGLRIRIDGASGSGGVVDDASVQAAMCLSCNRTWGPDDVGILARIIAEGLDAAASADVDALAS